MIFWLSMPLRDDSWLSLTPEPERLLPQARAVLRSGDARPPDELVEAERALAERLVVGGRKARWYAWLRESVALADRHDANDAAAAAGPTAASHAAAADPTAASAALVRDVVANHDALALGLPGERADRRR
jgi:hypothetical protein